MTPSAPTPSFREIERKFLVRYLPDEYTEHRFVDLRQGYLGCDSAGGVVVRVRTDGSRHLLTIKQGAGRQRTEVELPIDPGAFEALWPMTEGRRIEKRRYYLPCGTHVIELDVFGGAHRGLLLVEVEFASTAESSAFVPPSWFGSEVTDDARFTNHVLAMGGLVG